MTFLPSAVFLIASAVYLGYGRLLLISLLLIACGFAALVCLIPFSTRKIESDTKTEFFSARAASWCITVGLLMIALITIAALAQHFVLSVRGH